METKASEILRWIKANGGWSRDDPQFQEYLNYENALFKSFENRKVIITHSSVCDWLKSSGLIKGKIVFNPRDNQFMLIPKGRRTKGYFLTCGLFHGGYATKTVFSIEAISNK